MKKDNIILIGLLVAIALIAILCGFLAFESKEEQKELKTDAIKIK